MIKSQVNKILPRLNILRQWEGLTMFLLYMLVGYVVCVLFPLPWINRFIIDLWAKLLSVKTDE